MTDARKPAQDVRPQKQPRVSRARLIIGLIILGLTIAFIVMNNQKVEIHFVFFTVTAHLWIGFVVSVILGALLGQLFGLWRRSRRKDSSHAGR